MGTYDGWKAAKYAMKYALVYNNRWASDASGSGGGGDCTNFISQCLFAGGWSMIGSTIRQDPGAWYNYDPTTRSDRSYSWGGATPMYRFLDITDRAHRCSRIDLAAGDIISCYDKNAGQYTHNVMVTFVNPKNYDCWVCYHSHDTLNASITKLVGHFGQENLVYWKIKPKFEDQLLSNPGISLLKYLF